MSKFLDDIDKIDNEIDEDDYDEDDDISTKPKKTAEHADSDEEDDDESEDSIIDDNSDIDSDDKEDIGEITSSKEVGERGDFKSKFSLDLESDDENEDDDDTYLQKFDEHTKTNILTEYYPELQMHNNDEVDAMTRIVRDENGVIVDPLHRTLPFITKYERARILGERAKQINSGAKPLIPVEPDVIDGYLIALAEFEQKKIPFIVKRPLPNGGCEYWKLKDLAIL